MHSKRFFLSTLLGLSALFFSSCGGDGAAEWDVARSLSYDWSLEKCTKGIAQVDKMMELTTQQVDEGEMVMDFMLLSTHCSTLQSSIEGADVGPEGEIKNEIGELLKKATQQAEECEKMDDLGSALLKSPALDDPDATYKTLAEWSIAAKGQLPKYKEFFQSTEAALKDLRKRDPDYITPAE